MVSDLKPWSYFFWRNLWAYESTVKRLNNFDSYTIWNKTTSFLFFPSKIIINLKYQLLRMHGICWWSSNFHISQSVIAVCGFSDKTAISLYGSLLIMRSSFSLPYSDSLNQFLKCNLHLWQQIWQFVIFILHQVWNLSSSQICSSIKSKTNLNLCLKIKTVIFKCF